MINVRLKVHFVEIRSTFRIVYLCLLTSVQNLYVHIFIFKIFGIGMSFGFVFEIFVYLKLTL